MHNSKLKQLSVALCMVLMPISVFAAGLGKLNVMSGLGEPLKADIELISITPEELSSITAAIASEEAYAVQGIEKPASHNTIKVDIAKNAAGAPILKLKSTQPISEPFLDMLIQVDWASGRLLREYTVLLDPPGYTGEADSSAQAAQTTQAPMVNASDSMPSSKASSAAASGDAVSGTAAAPRPVKKSKKPSAVAPTEEVMASADASGDYVTQRGDTLSKLARDLKPDGVSLEQMLLGLYQENPNAFQGDNMNRLKVGQIIRPPSEATLSAISRDEAAKEVKVQTANWNAYRNKLAGIVADAAPNEAEASTQSAGGKIKSAEDKSIPESTGPKDVVKLSAGDAAAAKASADTVKSLQEKISALQEEATAREKSVKEAQDRTASLEKQIADMQKLLAMKNGAMADLQKQAEMQAADEKAKAEQAKAAEAAAVAKPVAETTQATPIESAPAATEAPKPEVATTEKPKPAVKPVPAPEPEPEQSFISSLLGGLDFGILAPAGGLLALLGGGWMYLRKKREKSLSDFEQGIMTSGGLKANTVFGNTASASVDTGDTSFLTDFSQSANGGMIDTNDVDPIAEAEVYMAYGRDAQAEEILKDAISKEPKRYELHLKLLEMYAASKNVSAFETISGELYTTLGAEDPTWAKVAEIGLKLEPGNPLYQGKTGAVGAQVAAVAVKGAADASEKLDATDFSDSPLAAEKDLDFSFDNDALTQGFAPTGTAKSADFDMDLGAPDESAAPAKPAAELVASSDLSFDMDLNDTAVKADPVAADNSGAMEFDMGDLGTFETAAPEEAPAKVTEEFGNTMPGLDIPTFAAPNFMPEADVDAPELAGVEMVELEKFGEASLETFEFPAIDEPAATEGVLDISGMSAEEPDANNFSFDVHTIQPEAASFETKTLAEPQTFDLSTIDLGLNDGVKVAVADDVAGANLPADGEPIEVDTKLDLVAAYIEMDDKVGAKELLDEVMKEGGAGQRKRAEALLAKLA